mgnify:CR=1 FL=1
MKYEYCEGACDYCFYAKRDKDREIIGCDYAPHSDLRDDLAINHHYCRYFRCEYASALKSQRSLS